MAIYEPASREQGKNATQRRVAALRALNEANGAQFRRYTGGGDPSYRVVAPDGTVREIATREVAAYIIGHADSYDGVKAHLEEVFHAALVDPEVHDQETLLRVVMEQLDQRCGDPLRRAAQHFSPQSSERVQAIA